MMNKIFEQEVSDMLEGYMDDVIVKSKEKYLQERHFASVFNRFCECNMMQKL